MIRNLSKSSTVDIQNHIMKTVNAILLMIVFIVPATLPAYSRQNPDSLLLAHSEQWTAKPNKGLFGLSKPQFGPYTTTAVIKLDSPVIKQKTKTVLSSVSKAAPMEPTLIKVNTSPSKSQNFTSFRFQKKTPMLMLFCHCFRVAGKASNLIW